MTFDIVSPASLGSSELARWAELQQQPVYRSPFFRPEFSVAMAELREVRVAVIEDAGTVIGFFPYEAMSSRAGRPVGWPRSNYHGPVLADGAEVDLRRLVRACDLATWSFDHLPAELSRFADHSYASGRSPYLDLSEGFEPYLQARRKRSDVRDTLGKTARKLAREVGPARFVTESPDAGLLSQLVQWKRAQYAETGVRDVLADEASRALLEHFHAVRGTQFAGALSVLYAGDVVAALQFGLRSATIWHCWFPAYNRELSKYSPGLMLLLELAREAARLGVREIDLGKGEAPYKLALSTGSHELLEGCLGATALSAFPVRARTSARHMLRRAGVHRAVRRAFHKARR
jgi:CelD/BcsL family acetyltransferase involved in cellulose biosynthesis